MANADQRSIPLTFSLRDLDTVKAECERFIPFGEGSSGVFIQGVKMEISQRATANEVEISFELTVKGETKGKEKAQLAFLARAKVACIATFPREQSDPLPEATLRELGTLLHTLASERCRFLTISMGYPAPQLGSLPALEISKATKPAPSQKSVSHAVKRPAKKIAAKKSPKSS